MEVLMLGIDSVFSLRRGVVVMFCSGAVPEPNSLVYLTASFRVEDW
jgi:hypothetical protein